MDTETGHLVTSEMLDAILKKDPKKAEKYTPVPEQLEGAAKKKLAGKNEAMVSLTSGGKLSKWAAHDRREQAKKKARKTAKKSRQRNR